MSGKNKLIFLIPIFLFAVPQVSMGMIEFLKICLFSEVNGFITVNGKPVVGAKVIRTSGLNSKTFTETTITDNEGYYHFDMHIIKSINRILPLEPYIPQKIIIWLDDKDYQGWQMVKRNYDVNGEIGAALNLKCELTKQPDITEQKIGSNIFGLCRWD